MNKTLRVISENCNGILFRESDGNIAVNGFFSDSRQAEPGKIFLALRGEHINGNTFVPDVIAKGACALVDDPDYFTKNCVLVPDVRKALRDIAEHYRLTELSDIPFVGITGSVGKTTTKDMVALALSAGKSVHKTPGNANSQIGLPTTVLDTEPGCGVAVVELGMSYKGEMERIARVARPDISIVTNIGHSHIENLGSREAIRDEKLKITAYSKKGAYLLLNGDEPLLRGIDVPNRKVYYISVEDNTADCFASSIVSSQTGTRFTASVFGKECEVTLNVRGLHFVQNALFALATTSLLGVDITASAKTLSGYKSDGRRQYIYETDGHTVISDCYNAAPESVRAALSVLGTYKPRRIAVLGDMLELGEKSAEYHANLGGDINKNADVLITYGTLARHYADNATIETHSFDLGEPKILKEFLTGFIKPGDTLLYKASNGIKLFDCII